MRLSSTQLVLLGATTPVDSQGATVAGVRACLAKPVRPSQLRSALRSILVADAFDTGSRAARIPSPAEGSLGRLLLVEDNTINQMVATTILKNLGYRVDAVDDGLAALEALARDRYSAVLMDCQMPRMDGYEATAEIRRRDWPSRQVPVIAMTAAALKGDRERCLAAGMDDYIVKPVRANEIQTVLARWLSRPSPLSPVVAADPSRA